MAEANPSKGHGDDGFFGKVARYYHSDLFDAVCTCPGILDYCLVQDLITPEEWSPLSSGELCPAYLLEVLYKKGKQELDRFLRFLNTEESGHEHLVKTLKAAARCHDGRGLRRVVLLSEVIQESKVPVGGTVSQDPSKPQDFGCRLRCNEEAWEVLEECFLQQHCGDGDNGDRAFRSASQVCWQCIQSRTAGIGEQVAGIRSRDTGPKASNQAGEASPLSSAAAAAVNHGVSTPWPTPEAMAASDRQHLPGCARQCECLIDDSTLRTSDRPASPPVSNAGHSSALPPCVAPPRRRDVGLKRRATLKSYAIIGNRYLVENYLADNDIVDDGDLQEMREKSGSCVFMTVDHHGPDTKLIFIVFLNRHDNEHHRLSVLRQVNLGTPRFLVLMEKDELPKNCQPTELQRGEKASTKTQFRHHDGKFRRVPSTRDEKGRMKDYSGCIILGLLKKMLQTFPWWNRLQPGYLPSHLDVYWAVNDPSEDFYTTSSKNGDLIGKRVKDMFPANLDDVDAHGFDLHTLPRPVTVCRIVFRKPRPGKDRPAKDDPVEFENVCPFAEQEMKPAVWLSNMLGCVGQPVFATTSRDGEERSPAKNPEGRLQPSSASGLLTSESTTVFNAGGNAACGPVDEYFPRSIRLGSVSSESSTASTSSGHHPKPVPTPACGTTPGRKQRSGSLSLRSKPGVTSVTSPASVTGPRSRLKSDSKQHDQRPLARDEKSGEQFQKMTGVKILQQAIQQPLDSEVEVANKQCSVPFPKVFGMAEASDFEQQEMEEVFWKLNGSNPLRNLIRASSTPLKVVTFVVDANYDSLGVGSDGSRVDPEQMLCNVANHVLGASLIPDQLQSSSAGKTCSLLGSVKATPTCLYVILTLVGLDLKHAAAECHSARESALHIAVDLSNLFVLLSSDLGQSVRNLASALDRASPDEALRKDALCSGLFSSDFLFVDISGSSAPKAAAAPANSPSCDPEATKTVSDVLHTLSKEAHIDICYEEYDRKDPEARMTYLQGICKSVATSVKNAGQYDSGDRFRSLQQLLLASATCKPIQRRREALLTATKRWQMNAMQEKVQQIIGSHAESHTPPAVHSCALCSPVAEQDPACRLTLDSIASQFNAYPMDVVDRQRYSATQEELVQRILNTILEARGCDSRFEVDKAEQRDAFHGVISRLVENRCLRAKDCLANFLQECGCADRLEGAYRDLLAEFRLSWTLCGGVCGCGYGCVLRVDHHQERCDCDPTGHRGHPCVGCSCCDWRSPILGTSDLR